jgi:hypothetical protein
MGLQMFAGVNQLQASYAAEEAAADAAEAQIEEYERQAEETRRMAQEDKSERSREADREFAALQVSSVDAGGLGTVNLLRLAGDIGGQEGYDLAKIRRNEKNAMGSLLAAAKGERATFKAYQKEQKYLRRGIAIGTLTNMGSTAMSMMMGGFSGGATGTGATPTSTSFTTTHMSTSGWTKP